MGMPTDKLLRMVESNDTRTHLDASARLVDVVTARSRTGFAGLEERRVDTGFDEVAFGVRDLLRGIPLVLLAKHSAELR
jgi:hypothetical protein